MQEEAHLAAHTQLAQHRAQRNHVVIVDPQRVAIFEQWRQFLGEQPVDAHIAFAGGAVVIDQIQTEVQQRPQRTIGEAVVVRIHVALVEVHGDELNVAFGLLVHAAAIAAYGLATPAEPHTAALFERCQQANRQTAGTVLAGHCNAIGYHHQTTHDASCQLRDKRIAAMINPTCE